MDVFINDMAMFMPNDPVGNEDIETVLGQVDNLPSKAKRIVLKRNGIEQRYYAISRETGELTHTNAQLTAEAVRRLQPHPGFSPEQIQCLCCGTTSPDVLFPGHGLMVLGELGTPACEAVTTAGICISGMLAFKYAWMNVALGQSQNAVATGSELASSFMRAAFFTAGAPDKPKDIESQPLMAFDTDFLRWMLSDGAGAAFLSDRPNTDKISLHVDWIENVSFAGELDTCMYCGGVKGEDGRVSPWRHVEDIDTTEKRYLMAVKQDIDLLNRNIVPTFERALSGAIEKHGLRADAIDWYLPHYSSAVFRGQFFDAMARIGFEIPYERWFTNLPTMGNTGAASIYIMLAELMHSGVLQPDQRLLCFIPESGRFSHCFMHLSVV